MENYLKYKIYIRSGINLGSSTIKNVEINTSIFSFDADISSNETGPLWSLYIHFKLIIHQSLEEIRHKELEGAFYFADSRISIFNQPHLKLTNLENNFITALSHLTVINQLDPIHPYYGNEKIPELLKQLFDVYDFKFTIEDFLLR